MRLAALVETTESVAATSSRSEKIDLLADLFRQAEPDEIEVLVGLVSGEPRQGKVGIGWSTVGSVSATPSSTSSLTIGDLDETLSLIASTEGPGSRQRRDAMLQELLARATAGEADFIRRLLLGELRQGANAGIVTDAVARATDIPPRLFRRAVMLSGDLGGASRVAAADGREGLEAIGLEVGRPIQPMLASTASSVDEALQALGIASVEWKLDGIRIQVHRDGDAVRIWSRNLNELTDRLSSVADVVRSIDAGSLILDGEVLGVDTDGRPVAFQDTVSVATDVTPYFFDILHHDGIDLLDAPLQDRRSVLERVTGHLAVPGVVTDDVDVAAGVFEEALARGHEGVVLKAAESRYEAGRRGKSWRKVKPVHTLDLVVLAVEHGSGRRSGWLSNIHLGARDPADGSFVMVGKTFKGMTDDMLRWQTDRFRSLTLSDDGRVVQLRPEQVVEIALDGVQRSTRYPGGVALRFARVVRYRSDKRSEEADTIDIVRSIG